MEIQWALVLFTAISGTGAWLFAFSMLGYLFKKNETPSKMETIVAFVLLVIGGCMSVLHLSHVDRILEALNRPTSGIFIEASLVGITCVILAVYFIMLVRGTNEKVRTAVGILGMLVGAVFSFACGSSYMMEARPAWDTIALPLAYFGTAAAAGAGLNLFLKALQKSDEPAISFSGLMAVVAGIAGVVLAGVFCALASAYVASSENGAIIWVVVLFAALLIEIVCGVLARKQPQSVFTYATIALVVGIAAALALRVAMFLIGSPFMNFFLMPLE